MAQLLDVERIYREHGHVVLRRARAILGSDVDARETLQEVFVSLLDRPGQFRGDSSITTFLYRMTTNMCLNKLRNTRTRTRILDAEAGGRTNATHGDPSDRVAVAALLASMPGKLRAVAIHYYVDDMSQDEIAAMLGCSRRNVGKLLTRVRRHAEEAAA